MGVESVGVGHRIQAGATMTTTITILALWLLASLIAVAMIWAALALAAYHNRRDDERGQS